MIVTCDGERNYLIYPESEYTKEKALRDARNRLGKDITIGYARRLPYNQYSVMTEEGDCFCITRKEFPYAQDKC